MKVCIKCNKEKDDSAFTRRKSETEIRRTVCTECCRKYQRKHYLENKKRYVERAMIFNKSQALKKKQLLFEFLQTKKCQDCGNDDVRVLEFDHKEGLDKMDNVSNMIYRRSWKMILKEIGKCEIRCANCHRIKTTKQFNYFKNK